MKPDNKPALFRKSQEGEPKSSDAMFDVSEEDNEKGDKSVKADKAKAWESLKKQLEMDFDPESKSMEELREFWRISKDKDPVEHMNDEMLGMLMRRLKDRQIKFYAFLNKEFNIMNYKTARCSMHCFDSTDRSMTEVNSCLLLCREGISGCKDFAFRLQTQAEKDLEKCQNEAQTLKKKNLTDPIIHWMSCYEKLINRFDQMENEIKDEFSNFI